MSTQILKKQAGRKRNERCEKMKEEEEEGKGGKRKYGTRADRLAERRKKS